MSRRRPVTVVPAGRFTGLGLLAGSITIGALMMLLGAYAAGGDDLTCERTMPVDASGVERAPSEPVVGSCRLVTRRWLGQREVAEARYGPVTGADTIAVSVQESSTDSNGRSQTRTVDRWHVRLLDGTRETARFGGSRDEVDRESASVNAWIADGARAPLHLPSTTWPFGLAAMAFGLLWLGMTALIARSQRPRSRPGA
jgi:hypothetical protein